LAGTRLIKFKKPGGKKKMRWKWVERKLGKVASANPPIINGVC